MKRKPLRPPFLLAFLLAGTLSFADTDDPGRPRFPSLPGGTKGPAPAPSSATSPRQAVPGDARWWDGFAGGNRLYGIVYSFAEYEGLLYAGGYISRAGGISVEQVAVWDGSSWGDPGFRLYGEYFPYPAVYGMASYQGDLVLAGDFYPVTGDQWGLARWDGESLSSIGDLETWLMGPVFTRGDTLLATGYCVFPGGEWLCHLAAWDGTSWSDRGGFDDWIWDVLDYDGRRIVAGYFTRVDGVPMNRIAAWDGNEWSGMGGGFNGMVSSLALYRGELYAAGNFSRRIARWNGDSWEDVGGGISGGAVQDLAVIRGELIACGDFDEAGGEQAARIAAWNGERWRPLGSGLDNWACVLHPWEGDRIGEDHLYVGGTFHSAGTYSSHGIARWDPIARRTVLLGRGAGGFSAAGSPSILFEGPVPNPFRGETTIRFRTNRAGAVALKVYDPRGRLVDLLLEGDLPEGSHAFPWGGSPRSRGLSPGVYFIRIETAEGTASAKAILTR